MAAVQDAISELLRFTSLTAQRPDLHSAPCQLTDIFVRRYLHLHVVAWLCVADVIGTRQFLQTVPSKRNVI